MRILGYLQSSGRHRGNHSIEFLLALHEITMQRRTPANNEVFASYNDMITWITNHGSNISTIAYQSRKAELQEMGIVEKRRRKKGRGEDIKLTEKGIEIAALVQQFASKLTKAYSETQ